MRLRLRLRCQRRTVPSLHELSSLYCSSRITIPFTVSVFCFITPPRPIPVCSVRSSGARLFSPFSLTIVPCDSLPVLLLSALLCPHHHYAY
jgi:hypothetical protein